VDTRRLAAAVSAADHGSLSKAAERLGAPLSTISRQISDLEEELGVPLFVRTGRGVRPTEVGERFIERARGVVADLRGAVAEARGEAGAEVARLRISVPAEMALSLLPRCLATLHAEHPSVALDVHSEARRVALLEEDYDAAIRLGTLTDSELLGRSVGTIDMVIAAAGPAPGLRVASLSQRPFVSVAGTGPSLVVRTSRGERTIDRRIAVRVSTFTEAARVAAASDLLVLLPSYTAARFFREGGLRRLLPRVRLPSVPAHVLLSRRHARTIPLRRLVTLVGEAIAEANRAVRLPRGR